MLDDARDAMTYETTEEHGPSPGAEDVLAGGGEMGARMRAVDWSATALGPVERWPRALKTCVRIMLTSRQPVWLGWGAELTYLYNDAYLSIIGGKHPWALGRPTAEVWREIWDDIGPRIRSALGGEEGTYDEALLLLMERHGYREETYYTFSYSPIPDDDGRVGGIFCANTAETERVIGERRTRLLRELAAATVDARTVGEACVLSARALETNPHDLPFALVYVLDADHRTAKLAGAANVAPGSPAAPESLGLDATAPWPIGEVVATGDDRVVDLRAWAGLPTGAWDRPPQRAVALPIAPAGETGQAGALVVGLNPYRLFDDDYRGFLGLVAGQIAAAVGNAEAYEAERRRAEELAELDRAKTAFFSNVSHEFRTPLTLLLGPLEEMLGDGLPAAQQEAVETAHRNALRLLRLVNTLLDFSRIEAGRARASYERTDLPAFTADLASAFRSAVERGGLRLVVDAPTLPAGLEVYVDRDMWEKVVLNLLSNAFKHTFEGEIAVGVRAAEDGRSVELTVRDTGTGIPAEELPRLFERFHRVQGARARTHEGTGIGLALVRELVEMHGGTVVVESEPGVGSTFRVTLPTGRAHLPAERIGAARAGVSTALGAAPFVEEAQRWLPEGGEAPADGGSPHPGPPPEGEGTGARVLLADDNADMREYVARLLRGRYDVEAVPDGAAALEAARRQTPDLVLSDVMMPGLDGVGLLRELRADPRTRDVPVVLLSARAGEEARIEGIDAGADDYLVKPFSARELLARVGTHVSLARGRAETTRRLAEQAERLAELNAALREGEQRLAAIFDRAAVGIAETDLEGRFVLVNDRYCEIVGRSRAELLAGRRMQELTHPDDLATNLAMFGRLVRDGADFAIEKRYVRPDGTAVWVRNSVSRVDDPDGTPRYALAMSEEITARRRAEAEVLRQREDLRAMLMQAPVPIAVVAGPELIFEVANPPYVRVTGDRELLGKPVLETLPELAGQGYDDFLREVMRTGRGVVGEESLLRLERDGALQDTYWTFIYAPLRNPDGVVDRVMAICQEVTAQVRARQEIEAALRVRDEFLSIAAHELRTPVTSAKGNAQLALRALQRGELDAARSARHLTAIVEAADRLQALLADLLDVSRMRREGLSVRPEAVDLTALVGAVAQRYAEGLGDAHRLAAELPTRPLVVQGDPVRLEQVLDNMLGNAVKYSPAGGEIRVALQETDAGVALTVQDQGIGLPPGEAERIFEPFGRATNAAAHGLPGMGLGLHISRQIVEAHRGRMWAESDGEGRGTRVHVRLPR